MILFCCFIFGIYCLSMLQLYVGFDNIKTFETQNTKPKTKFSVVIPFRNEAHNLPNLLGSFEKLNYPICNFEIILVDDDSDDNFILQSHSIDLSVIKNIRKSSSAKKDAILTAIKNAKFDWIVTTDADCLVGENWLQILDQFIQNKNVEMIVGAVKYESENSFLHQFQALDIASLQGVTIGSFGISSGFMCNGANFAYTKNLFASLNGFEGNNQIASGDDVFLLQKAMSESPKKVGYLKSSGYIVTTKPLDSWPALFYQRVRWASKTFAYKSVYAKMLGSFVFATNILTVYCLISILFNFKIMILILLFSKFIVDAMIIIKTNKFLQSKTKFLLLGSLCYPFFSVGVALYSMFGKYNWKGRKI